MTEDTIMVCDCVAAEVDFLLYIRHGCFWSRWVRIGSRIKPDVARGAPAGKIVCLKSELPRKGLCKFQSLAFLIRDFQGQAIARSRSIMGPRSKELLQEMEEEVFRIRERLKDVGIQDRKISRSS